MVRGAANAGGGTPSSLSARLTCGLHGLLNRQYLAGLLRVDVLRMDEVLWED